MSVCVVQTTLRRGEPVDGGATQGVDGGEGQGVDRGCHAGAPRMARGMGQHLRGCHRGGLRGCGVLVGGRGGRERGGVVLIFYFVIS